MFTDRLVVLLEVFTVGMEHKHHYRRADMAVQRVHIRVLGYGASGSHSELTEEGLSCFEGYVSAIDEALTE